MGRLASSSLTHQKRMLVYLIVIGWLYVVLMMAVAEASNTTGTVLGAIVTFVLYGLLPIVLVIYLMRTPQRRRENKAREAAEDQAQRAVAAQAVRAASGEPDAGGHASTAAESDGVAPVRKEV
jgi:cytochrome bd-type quinol oxidase subunit 1